MPPGVVSEVLAAMSRGYSGKMEIPIQSSGKSREADPDGGDTGQWEKIIRDRGEEVEKR